MKQKHRKWSGVLLASALMLLSATGSGYATENSGHSAYARYLENQGNATGGEFVPLFDQISLSSDFHNMLRQWNENVRRPLKEMASLLSDSQQAAAETLLRNLNTSKTSEDKGSSVRMVQAR